jgi:hypothetical protein
MQIVMQIVLLACLTLPASIAQGLEFQPHPKIAKPRLTAIFASGTVEPGDALFLQGLLRKMPRKPHTAVYLSSPGGDLYEGMRLGRFFRKNRIKTVIEGGAMCASACAIAFLGGRDRNGKRWMSSTTTSKLGFHAFRNGDGTKHADTDKIQRIVADVLMYAQEVRAPSDILQANFGTSAADMYWLRQNELLALGIKVWDLTNDCFLPCR